MFKWVKWVLFGLWKLLALGFLLYSFEKWEVAALTWLASLVVVMPIIQLVPRKIGELLKPLDGI